MGNLCSRIDTYEPGYQPAWQQGHASRPQVTVPHNSHLLRQTYPTQPGTANAGTAEQPGGAAAPGAFAGQNVQASVVAAPQAGLQQRPCTGAATTGPATSATPTTSNNTTASNTAQQREVEQPAGSPGPAQQGHAGEVSSARHVELFVHSPRQPAPGSPFAQHQLDDTCPQTQTRFNWTKGKLIGSGAFGRVFQGLDNDTGHIMAVKQVTLTKDEALKGRLGEHIRALEAEVAVLRQLNHRNIVRYLGTERTDDTLNIFLEFVPGGSIASLIEKFGPLQERLVKLYTYQILQGLEYLHKKKIMHRDIKGANILVDPAGTVKLADFGASRKIEDLATVASGSKSIRGTPFWMAPEVIKQTGHGRPADIWSLGCVVIEMATGKPPWSNCNTQVAAMFHIASTKEPPAMPEQLSKEARDFLLLCFNRVPKDRPNATRLLQHDWLRDVHMAASASITASMSVGIAPSVAFHQPTQQRHPLVPMLALQHSHSPPSPIKEESETVRDTSRSIFSSNPSAAPPLPPHGSVAVASSMAQSSVAPLPRASTTRASKVHAALHMPLAIGPLEQGRRQALLAQSQARASVLHSALHASTAVTASTVGSSPSPPPAAASVLDVASLNQLAPAGTPSPPSSTGHAQYAAAATDAPSPARTAAVASQVAAQIAAQADTSVAVAGAGMPPSSPPLQQPPTRPAPGPLVQAPAEPPGLDIEALTAVAANAVVAPTPPSPQGSHMPHPSMLTLNFNPVTEPSWNSQVNGELPAGLLALAEEREAAAQLTCIQESGESDGDDADGHAADSESMYSPQIPAHDAASNQACDTQKLRTRASMAATNAVPATAAADGQVSIPAAAVAHAEALAAAGHAHTTDVDAEQYDSRLADASDTLADKYDQPDAWCQTLALNESAGWLQQGKAALATDSLDSQASGIRAALDITAHAASNTAGAIAVVDVTTSDVASPALHQGGAWGSAAKASVRASKGSVNSFQVVGGGVRGSMRTKVGRNQLLQHAGAGHLELLKDDDPVRQSKKQKWASELDAELAALRQQRGVDT